MRRPLLISTAVVLSLSIISTVFSILTAASPRWAVQNYYRGMGDMTTYTSVLCPAHRSPFYRCGLPRVGDDGKCRIPSCRFYPPSGTDRTSCRVPAEVGAAFLATSVLDGTQGSYMECQQVHTAGNLQIAATTFTGVGLLVSLAFFATIFLSHHPRRDEGATADQSRETKGPTTASAPHHHRHHSRSARALPFLTVTLVFFFTIGAALQVLAQFFGVLGLTQNATPNASLVVQEAAAGFQNFGASDWTLDIALVRYASVAWFSAILCAVGTCWLFWKTRRVMASA